MLKSLALPALFAAAAFAATPEEANLRYFRDLAETRNFTLGKPTGTKITPDGRHAIFLRSAPRDPTLRLYELELASGRERELLTPAQLLGNAEENLSVEEKARRERSRQSLRGFTSFQLTGDGTRLLVSLSGKLYVVRRDTLRVTELPGTGWIDPRFSPDGQFVAAAGADRELHVIDLAAVRERPLTQGATPTLSHATADFIAQEEMMRYVGYWWSPDSRTLLYQQTDEAKVESRYIADPLHPEQPPQKFFFARAGTPNATVRLFLVSREGGSPLPVAWDNTAFPYLAHAVWSENAPPVIVVQNREQTDQRLLAIDPASGKTRELLRETDSAWVNLDEGGGRASVTERRPPHWFKDGSHFLWTTERRGAWQVELRSASGALVREFTPLTWTYHDLVGLDEANGWFYARGGDDSRDVHVWRFPLAGGPGVRLTNDPGFHNASLQAKAGLLVRTLAPFSGEGRQEVIAVADHRVVATLPSTAENPPALPTTELTRTAGTRSFEAAITRPRTFAAGKKYPVILYVYAGPGNQFVLPTRLSYFLDQWMADQGYIVVRLDGRGTPGRGREWERIIKGNVIDVALEDQIAGLQALAGRHAEIDLTRVGVTGWSFGGYFSAMATIRRPDIFRCGVAGAPVATWQDYTTHYTERYLGLPAANPEAYRVSNVTTYAGQLKRPLLLIHGLTDDNVYFQHTLQIADALFLAGKPYELMPMLGTHMISDPQIRVRQQTRIMEFFARELKP